LRAGVGAGHHLSVARCRLSGLRGAPRTQSTPNQDGYGFRPTRWRFDAPRVFVRRAVAHDLAVVYRPSLRFRAPLETCHCSPAPRRRRPTVPKDRRATRPAMLPLLGFRALRHIPGPADPLRWRQIPLPPRATCEVWLPPSRLPPPVLPARVAPERPWASPFKVFPSSRWVPLSGSLPS
jgi:hypothetical protein